MDFKDTLKACREKSGLQVVEAAKKAGLSFSFWYEMERGDAQPSITTINAIKKALNCTTADLFNETPEKIVC